MVSALRKLDFHPFLKWKIGFRRTQWIIIGRLWDSRRASSGKLRFCLVPVITKQTRFIKTIKFKFFQLRCASPSTRVQINEKFPNKIQRTSPPFREVTNLHSLSSVLIYLFKIKTLDIGRSFETSRNLLSSNTDVVVKYTKSCFEISIINNQL